MCGINGILRLDAEAPPVDRDELLRTRDAMTSRGPDGSGLWISEDGRLGLGHRRLAIIDLSPAGLQPMSRADGRYHIVFNGEIYNYRELRRELSECGEAFASHSDTEVILALYARQGAAMLSRLRGMYALAIWDARERRLLLARDPYGIKPLYYAQSGHELRFASQVKALVAGGKLPGGADAAGLVGFLLWGSVPEPHCLERGVRALPSGHHLIVCDGRVGSPVAHHSFCTPADVPVAADSTEAMKSSVCAHLVSDVPVGVFLSAGLDSGLIAALAQREHPEALSTFTLRFDDYRDTPADEGPLAAEVARTLGAEHVERRVGREEFLDLWPRALAAMDQPSIDGFNTYVVSHAAHEAGFKVVLSGLGGDELMGGYSSFRDVPSWSRWAATLGTLPGARRLWPWLAGRIRPTQPKLAGLLRHGGSLAGAYYLRRGLFLPEELTALIGATLAREGLATYDPLGDAAAELSDACAWEAVHRMESTQYMRNQLLRDADWASMAHSLELRVPLVDAWLRSQLAATGFEPGKSGGKVAVVRRAAPELPPELWDRPKSGFQIPVMEWLDERIDIGTARGLASRKLALRVLESFGVSLAMEDVRGRRAIA